MNSRIQNTLDLEKQTEMNRAIIRNKKRRENVSEASF
jgi:hypothetical protein